MTYDGDMNPDLVTFWHSGPLHKIHRMCLMSQVKLGYRVTLYSYARIENLPDGVTNADAAEVLPPSFLERLQPLRPGPWTNHPLLHLSDFIRFRLQHLGRGLWLDTDIYLIRPFEIDPARPFFAWESRKFLGSAVLYLPSAHPILESYERLLAAPTLMPDWLSPRLRVRRALWTMLGIPHGPQDLSTLIFGPMALTQLARRHGCLDAALPSESFYRFARSHRFFEPSRLADILDDPNTFGIHVQRKARWNAPPVKGSMYEWALANVGAEKG